MEVKLIRLLSTINKFYIFFLLRSNVYIVDFEQTLYLILAPLRRFLSGLSRRMWNGSSSCLFLYVKRIALNPLSLCETITLNYNDAFTKNIRQLNILGFTYAVVTHSHTQQWRSYMQLTASLQLRVLLLCTAPFAFNTSYIHHRLIQNPVKRKDGAFCEKKHS